MKSQIGSHLRVLGVAALLAMLAGTQSVVAAPPVPPLPPAGEGVTVVDADQMATVVDIVKRIEPHLYVDEDGMVRLDAVSADELGVSEQFLADYRQAMEESNQLIRRGEIRVSRDLRVSVVAPPAAGRQELVLDGMSESSASQGAAVEAPSVSVPQWAGWNYGQGAMFFNTFEDWTYYRYNYYGLCNGMAAWIGMPRMGPVLIVFYGYNQYYIALYCYPSYGTYFYIPYGYIDYPFGYKPGYFWARQFGYISSCRCYGYQWLWLGFWLRY